jgi:hypothetical protein
VLFTLQCTDALQNRKISDGVTHGSEHSNNSNSSSSWCEYNVALNAADSTAAAAILPHHNSTHAKLYSCS